VLPCERALHARPGRGDNDDDEDDDDDDDDDDGACGSIGGCCISTLLAVMGLALARLNQRYLLGQSVEPEITEGKMLLLLLLLMMMMMVIMVMVVVIMMMMMMVKMSMMIVMGLALARLNQRYLLGQSVDPEIVDGVLNDDDG
jgi:positive regulator of sigma E activity